MTDNATPFARFGGEKMIYDIRMGPQALRHGETVYVAYQANPDGQKALPNVVSYDLSTGSWAEPVVIGDVTGYDHHFAPILWLDGDKHLHALFNCHGGAHNSVHRISTEPLRADSWREGPEVASSVTYPRVLRTGQDELILFYRTFGHMGYWTYQVSKDGGYSWKRADVPLVDFDQEPEENADTWAGTYHSAVVSRSGGFLHLAFVYWDERRRTSPLYGLRLGSIDRYHLYYACVEVASGRVYTIDGKRLELPLNRRRAEECKVWDTGLHLTNMPSVLLDDDGSPSFLVPAAEGTTWECRFHFITRERGEWVRYPVTEADSTWAGCHLQRDEDPALRAFLIGGRTGDAKNRSYGGGVLQEWRSFDNGRSWGVERTIQPEPGLLCNNPRPVEAPEGFAERDFLVFYGWDGPDSIEPLGPSDIPMRLRGKAYMWRNGEWL